MSERSERNQLPSGIAKKRVSVNNCVQTKIYIKVLGAKSSSSSFLLQHFQNGGQFKYLRTKCLERTVIFENQLLYTKRKLVRNSTILVILTPLVTKWQLIKELYYISK